MMQDDAARTCGKYSNPRQARTAANMADALSFLIRIALQAGMQNVAANLVAARDDLQAFSTRADSSDQEELVRPGQGDHNRLTRLN